MEEFNPGNNTTGLSAIVEETPKPGVQKRQCRPWGGNFMRDA
jgi:hypothetical protein